LTLLALVPAFALVIGIVPAGAQPQLPRFELVPRAGVLAPVTDLGKALDPEVLFQIEVKLHIAFMAGFTAQYNPAYWPVSFRLAFDYTPFNATTKARPALCEVVTGPACRAVPVDTRYMVLAGDVLIRAGDVETSHLYLMLGLGIKRYDFAEVACEVDDIVCNLLNDYTRDQTNPTVHLGLGYDFRLGPARLQVELADYMSTHRPDGEDSSGQVQQDLYLSLGLRLAVL
jgi:hypothetical protein